MPAVASRQLNISLPENVLKELETIAERSSMEEVIRTALALVKIASDASDNKQKLLIADQSGRTIKEIVIHK
jgi:hypothetical protein